METSNPKVVVIGAGIGGLSAALRLQSSGFTVTVVEAASGPGGKMRTLPSAAGPVNAGPTVLTMRSVFDDLFAAAGARLEDHVTLIRQPLLARHWWPDGSSLDLFDESSANEAAIGTFAGAKAAAQFRRFDARTRAAFAAFDAPVMRAPKPHLRGIAKAALTRPALWPMLLPGMTLARWLTLEFSDPRLRQLFGRYATYVGGAPDRVSAVLGLVWQAEAQGVWAVEGGMHQLALALTRVARAAGVEFRFGTRALAIQQHWSEVSGVSLSDGHTLPCARVVFNGDPGALAAGMLGAPAQAALPKAGPRSLSAQVWAFAAQPSGPIADRLVHHNVLFCDDAAQEFGPIAKGQLPRDPTLYICAQDRGGLAPPSGAERFEIILNAPAGAAPRKDEDQTCQETTLRQLARHGLTFDPQPQGLTTPSGFAALFPGSQGAIYGRSPEGMLAAFQRPPARTSLRGLYLAGGGAHPGAGVPMAALSGRHAAEAIMQDRISGSRSDQTAMPGGMSTASATTGRAPSR